MSKLTRGAAALVLGSTLAATAAAQAPRQPGAPPTPPPAQVPPPASVVPPGPPAAPKPEVRPQGVAAKVNHQEIPEVAVYRGLRQFPPSSQEAARKELLTHLIETALVDQYLTALKVDVPAPEVDKLIGELKKELADSKPPKDYQKELDAMMLTEAEFRVEVLAQMKWEKFITQQATDEALRKLFASSPDVFDGTLVRARHILLTPGNDPAKQQEAANTLRGIKQVCEQEGKKAADALPANADAAAREKARTQKIDELFAAYAKERSACPSKREGGDLNLFPRAGAMVEPFAKVAFELKPFQMSDVVATEFGYHLILVTDRKQGTPKKFEEVKEDVKVLFAMRLREAVIAQMKPRAQITITPVTVPTSAPGQPGPGGPGAIPKK
jgi:peptidyl-prolyl cis-trans isomerase C